MKMKIKVTILLTGCFLLVSMLGAAASVSGEIRNGVTEEVRQEILRQLPFPDFPLGDKEESEVRALISVAQDGQVTLHEIISADNELKAYVEKQLRDLRLTVPIGSSKFILVMKFRAV